MNEAVTLLVGQKLDAEYNGWTKRCYVSGTTAVESYTNFNGEYIRSHVRVWFTCEATDETFSVCIWKN